MKTKSKEKTKTKTQLKIKQVLNDSILVKIKKQSPIMTTKSGLFVTGVEQDYFLATVIMTGPGVWEYNKDTDKEEFHEMTVKKGDVVVLEKNFHHVYDVRRRDRVDRTIEVQKGDEGDDYDYFLTKLQDVYLKLDNKKAAKKTELYGELYSTMEVKPSIKRK